MAQLQPVFAFDGLTARAPENMVSFAIFLRNVSEIKRFVDIAKNFPFDVEILSGKYVVNAKSLMGVFSLDLSQKVILRADCAPDDRFVAEIMPFQAAESA